MSCVKVDFVVCLVGWLAGGVAGLFFWLSSCLVNWLVVEVGCLVCVRFLQTGFLVSW